MLPLSIRPYLRNTVCPSLISSPLNSATPCASSTCDGIGGALRQASVVTVISPTKPSSITNITLRIHQGESAGSSSVNGCAATLMMRSLVYRLASLSQPPRGFSARSYKVGETKGALDRCKSCGGLVPGSFRPTSQDGHDFAAVHGQALPSQADRLDERLETLLEQTFERAVG